MILEEFLESSEDGSQSSRVDVRGNTDGSIEMFQYFQNQGL